MDRFKVNIPNPCDKQWNNMTPNEEGRFCDSCNLTVVDFTSMSTEAIKTYFENKKGQNVCGHYYAHQTTAASSRLHQILSKLYSIVDRRFSFKPVRISALFFISAIMTMVGCQSHTEGEKTIPANTDSSSVYPDTSKTSKHIEDTIQHVVGRGA
jgi:hypothetical protein